MRNIRNICIGILVILVICYASPSERKNEIEGNKSRVRRYTKVPESTSESVKKQKSQKKKHSSVERSQLAQVPNYEEQMEMSANLQNDNTRLTPNMNVDAANGLLPPQMNGQPLANGVNTNPLDFPNMLRQLGPYNTNNNGGLQNYANNFPYLGYPPQRQTQNGFMGYFYGNPNIPFAGMNPAQPMIPQGYYNMMGQQAPLSGLPNGLQPFSAGYANNFMNFAPFPGAPSGMPNSPGVKIDPFGPTPPMIPTGSNNIVGGLQNPSSPNVAEQSKPPMRLQNNNNFNGQPGSLPDVHQQNPAAYANNFMSYGSYPFGQPGLPNSQDFHNIDPQFGLNPYQPQPSLQPSPGPQQPFDIFANAIPYGPQTQDVFPESQSFGGGALPEFSRYAYKRSLKLKNKT